MAASDRAYRPDLLGRAEQSFEEVNPKYYGKVQRDPEALHSLRLVADRSRALQQKLNDHLKKNESVWIANEINTIWLKRNAVQVDHPIPKSHANDTATTNLIMQQARRNVKARMTHRLMNLNKIKSRMENTIVRTTQYKQQNLDCDAAPQQQPRTAVDGTLKQAIGKAMKI